MHTLAEEYKLCFYLHEEALNMPSLIIFLFFSLAHIEISLVNFKFFHKVVHVSSIILQVLSYFELRCCIWKPVCVILYDLILFQTTVGWRVDLVIKG